MDGDFIAFKLSELGYFVNPSLDYRSRYHPTMGKVSAFLAKNLRRLMDASEDLKKEADFKKKCGVAQSQINRMLNPGHGVSVPKIDTVEKVANAFKLEAWHILSPDLELVPAAYIVAKEWMSLDDSDREKYAGLIHSHAIKTKQSPPAPEIPVAADAKKRTRIQTNTRSAEKEKQ